MIGPDIRTLCQQLNSETGKYGVSSTLPVTILFAQWKWRNFCIQECEN